MLVQAVSPGPVSSGVLADMVTLCRHYEQQEWEEAAGIANSLGLSDDDYGCHENGDDLGGGNAAGWAPHGVATWRSQTAALIGRLLISGNTFIQTARVADIVLPIHLC